jgi:hypothetical protein
MMSWQQIYKESIWIIKINELVYLNATICRSIRDSNSFPVATPHHFLCHLQTCMNENIKYSTIVIYLFQKQKYWKILDLTVLYNKNIFVNIIRIYFAWDPPPLQDEWQLRLEYILNDQVAVTGSQIYLLQTNINITSTLQLSHSTK